MVSTRFSALFSDFSLIPASTTPGKFDRFCDDRSFGRFIVSKINEIFPDEFANEIKFRHIFAFFVLGKDRRNALAYMSVQASVADSKTSRGRPVTLTINIVNRYSKLQRMCTNRTVHLVILSINLCHKFG